jgi:hypothetical protein
MVCVFWFHPLLWLVEREHACDELVIACGTQPQVYAAGILKIRRSGRSGTVTTTPNSRYRSGADQMLTYMEFQDRPVVPQLVLIDGRSGSSGSPGSPGISGTVTTTPNSRYRSGAEQMLTYMDFQDRPVVPQLVLIDRDSFIHYQTPLLGDPESMKEDVITKRIEELLKSNSQDTLSVSQDTPFIRLFLQSP